MYQFFNFLYYKYIMKLILDYNKIKTIKYSSKDILKLYNEYNDYIKSTKYEKLLDLYYDFKNIKNSLILKTNWCHIKETLLVINKLEKTNDKDLSKIIYHFCTTNNKEMVALYLTYMKSKIAKFYKKYIGDNEKIVQCFIDIKLLRNEYLKQTYSKDMKFDKFMYTSIIENKDLYKIYEKMLEKTFGKSFDSSKLPKENSVAGKYIDLFRTKYSYAMFEIYNIIELVHNLKELKIKSILEIGSGNGLYAYIITEICNNIKYKLEYFATDYDEFRKTWKFRDGPLYFKYINIGPLEAVEKYKTDALFLCWPPQDYMAFVITNKFTGKYLIDIGQFDDQVTGNDKYYYMISKDFSLIRKIYIYCAHSLYIHRPLLTDDPKIKDRTNELNLQTNIICIYKRF